MLWECIKQKGAWKFEVRGGLGDEGVSYGGLSPTGQPIEPMCVIREVGKVVNSYTTGIQIGAMFWSSIWQYILIEIAMSSDPF